MDKMISVSEVEAFLGINSIRKLNLASIATCFSERLYGARIGRKIKKALDELEKERQVAK